MPESSEEAIVLPAALHARPAAALVRATAPFDATVEIYCGDRSATARGVLGVLALGATAGSTVVVRVSGPDAEAALKAAVESLTTSE